MNGWDACRVAGLLCSAMAWVGCQSPEHEPRGVGPLQRMDAEVAMPEQPGELGHGMFFVGDELQELDYDVKLGFAVHQGDIILGHIETMSPLQLGEDGVTEAAVKPDSLWAHGIVPYVFDPGLPQEARDAFIAAVEHWEAYTALVFVERRDQPDYIRVVTGSGCSSHVGRIGGEQPLTLGPGCETMGIAAHEIGHAIGFYHEQSRSDRDRNVIIHWENIQEDRAFNFQTYAEQGALGEDVGGYNTGSIMHYGSTAFSIDPDNLPTITTLDGTWFGANREGLTSTDLEGATRLYGPPGGEDNCGAMFGEERLGRGEARRSCDGRFVLIMQGDGNLVLYQGNTPLWHSATYGTAASFAVMQGDGNLVVYEDGGKPLWASDTHGNPGSTLVVQDDGNLVIYNPEGRPLWASDTCCR